MRVAFYQWSAGAAGAGCRGIASRNALSQRAVMHFCARTRDCTDSAGNGTMNVMSRITALRLLARLPAVGAGWCYRVTGADVLGIAVTANENLPDFARDAGTCRGGP